MEFRTYPKLPRTPDSAGSGVGGAWVALEKVHGAQLVVGVGPGEIGFGKRKGWLQGEPFFGWQVLRPSLELAARGLYDAVGGPQLWLYLELYGGSFAAQSTAGLQAVQTGIDYTPDLAALCFDAIVAASDDDPGEWLADSVLRELGATCGLRVPPLVARGPRGQLASLPVAFPSLVPSLHGLSSGSTNLAEGLVLKPDARLAVGRRPIYKRKHPDFDDAKFAQATAWNPGRLTLAELRGWLPRLVNPARVASARSKVGANHPALVDEVGVDVAIDLAELFTESWEALAEPDQSALIDEARGLAVRLLAAG